LSDALSIVGIGIGATVAMDLWGVVRAAMFGGQMPNYRLVGRWIGHMARGRFFHRSIAASPPVQTELLVGWAAHYLIGVGFAAVLVGLCGPDWLREPTVAPALAVGVATVLAPFLIMQPAMGSGIAASRVPSPLKARIQSLLNHFVFGVGLYASASVVRAW